MQNQWGIESDPAIYDGPVYYYCLFFFLKGDDVFSLFESLVLDLVPTTFFAIILLVMPHKSITLQLKLGP